MQKNKKQKTKLSNINIAWFLYLLLNDRPSAACIASCLMSGRMQNDDATLSFWWAPKLLYAPKVSDGDTRYASPKFQINSIL